MPKYQVDIPHSVPPEDAKRLVAGATEKLQRDYGATCTWKAENTLSVSRKGLDALTTLETTRAFSGAFCTCHFLTPFAERIKAGIAKELAGILAKPV